MKKVLLLLLVSISITSFAQDWAPFKTTDTIRHYSSNVNNSNNIPQNHQVQSVVKSNSSPSGLLFKRGFTRVHNPWYDSKQIIKGQIFGDSMFLRNNSVDFRTIDSFGFNLSFPKSYFSNQTFILGYNVLGKQLHAFVDSIYLDSVNNAIDSLVRFRLSYTDSVGTADTSSNYHNSTVVISKNNGMIEGIDFTNLRVVVPVNQYFSKTDRIRNSDHFSLSIGDEYHYSDYATNSGFGDHFSTTVRITADVLAGTQRTITFEKMRQKSNPPPSGPVVTSVYSNIFSNTADFAIFESQIIEDSSFTQTPQWTPPIVINVDLFYLCDFCGFNRLGLMIDSINYNIEYSFFTGKRDSIFNSNSLLSYTENYIMVGVGDYGYYSYRNGNSNSKSIGYVKKGNQTWGTPLNLTVGIDEVNQTGELRLYPNPASNQLQIETEEQLRSVLISDINGKAVEVNVNKNLIDISNLSSGLYFIQVETEEGIFREKFVKE